MTVASIISGARLDGLTLSLSPTGTIRVVGVRAVVDRWLPALRDHKSGVVAVLRAGTGESGIGFRWWWIDRPDGDSIEVVSYPDATSVEIREMYPGAIAVRPFSPVARRPSVSLNETDVRRIRAWLVLIGESADATIRGVIEKCQRDAEARSYFLGRAAESPDNDA